MNEVGRQGEGRKEESIDSLMVACLWGQNFHIWIVARVDEAELRPLYRPI